MSAMNEIWERKSEFISRPAQLLCLSICALICFLFISVAPNLGQTNKKVEAANVARSPLLEVAATVETEPVSTGGDSADDTTLWVNPSDPSQSLIIGTNKQRGLAVYDLTGKQLQFLPDGNMNNVDHRDGFTLGAEKVSLVTSSNRSNNSIGIYRVNPATRRLENVAARRIPASGAYGACMYHNRKTDKFYCIVTSKQGIAEQFELFDDGKGRVDARSVRRFKVGTQIEGCVADDELGHLYIGEEQVGIWKYQAEPDAKLDRVKVDGVAPAGHLVADVEGLTIASGKDGKGYLIASSQGDNSYVVYRREGDNAFVKKFRIAAGNGIDEVTDSDGISVTTVSLGTAFPRGVFIAQDGVNDKANQNFKLVPWQLIVDEK
ncbi:MAG: phytase [Acidobacteriota bacterium]